MGPSDPDALRLRSKLLEVQTTRLSRAGHKRFSFSDFRSLKKAD